MTEINYQEIEDGDWNNLIILDACRFDAFKKYYPKYLEGTLKKRKSRGSCTVEWLVRNFTDYYDLTYFSANPYCNSLSVPLKRIITNCKPEYADWTSADHFKSIIDVWQDNWSDKYHTVTPSAMRKVVEKSKSKGKQIIHFMQPHQPYIASPPQSDIQSRKKITERNKITNKKNKHPLSPFQPLYQSLYHKITNKRQRWKIRKFLFKKDFKTNQIRNLATKGKFKRIKKLYKENLLITLRELNKLTPHLNGGTIITADHGEMLGENRMWSHTYNSDHPILRIVPWFEVKK